MDQYSHFKMYHDINIKQQLLAEKLQKRTDEKQTVNKTVSCNI